MIRKTTLLILLVALYTLAQAQKQANYWYFGQYAGISFALGPPAAVTNGALSTGEGCSSISTADGALEFYTDGRFVYNRNHQQMPNGSGLKGNSSSTQSGIIVPKPGSSTEYYIFTVDAADNGLADGLCYTKVDMTLNNGLGDVVVTEKNVSLLPLSCEKVTAVGHADGYSFWVITKKWGNDEFYSYRITGDGVGPAVISHAGPPLIGNIGQDSKGYIKVSPDGTKVVTANNTKYTVGIFNFDNSTGLVSEIVTDNSYTSPGGGDPGGPYGVEFSPNSKVLYIGEWKAHRRIFQYDLSSGDPTVILASKLMVASVPQNSDPIGALQLGPDNRMYIARYGSPYLSRINQPNVVGTGCGFTENAVSLGGRESRYGLPPFIQSFFFLSADFYWDDPACDGNLIHFNTSASDTPDSVRWTFPDGSHCYQLDTTYLFPGPGLYGVQLVVYLYGVAKNVSHFIRVRPSPTVALGNDTTICRSEAFYIDPGEFNSYLWQNGSTAQTELADSTDWYWCRITNEWGCPAVDSMYVTVNPNPDISAGPDKTIPDGSTAVLEGSIEGGSGNYSIHWEPAALLLNPNILQPTTVAMNTTTTFTLTVTNLDTGCTSESQVLITVAGGVLTCTASASPNNLCLGEQSQLQAYAYGGTGEFTFTWTSNPPGFTSSLPNPVVNPSVNTIYYLSVYDGENTVSAQTSIYVNALPVANAGPDQLIAFGTNTTLHGSATQGSGTYQYQWEPANLLVSPNVANPQTFNLYMSTVFTLYVTDMVSGCEGAAPDYVSITMDGSALSAQPAAEPDTVCAGTAVQLFALAGGGTQQYSYAWSSEPAGFTSTSGNPTIEPEQTTHYNVTVCDGYNCVTEGVTVYVKPLPTINLIPSNDPRVQFLSPTEIGVCVFDTISLNAGDTGSSYLWSNGSVNQSIDIYTSGISFDLQHYDVTVTDAQSGCSSNASISAYFTFLNCSYGIDDKENDNRLQVYPNPSGDGIFNLNIVGLTGETSVGIFTSGGRLIYSEKISLVPGTAYSSGLNLQNNAPGIYYLKLTNNEAAIVRKLIIQKQ